MTKILENFLADLIYSLMGMVNDSVAKMMKTVFFVENHLSDNSIFDTSELEQIQTINIFFNNIFTVTTAIGISLCMFKLAKKIFDTYILNIDGDNSSSVERMLLGFIKALIVIFSFNSLYILFADISIETINAILEAVGLSTTTDLDVYFVKALGISLGVTLGVLVFFIAYIILTLQFMMRGLEMLVLRLGIPFAVTGLIDSDNGVFAPYIKLFIQNSFTVLIQLAMLKLSLGLVVNGNLLFGIASIVMAIKSPKFVEQFMVGVGSVNPTQINSGFRMARAGATGIAKAGKFTLGAIKSSIVGK